MYMFSDGKKTIYVESEIYWSGYTVWTVSDENLKVEIASYATLNQLKVLSAEDAMYVQKAFSNIIWNNEGTTENLSDVYFIIGEKRYRYDSNDGILNDITNGRWAKFDDDVIDGINNCISRYVTLGQFD